MAVWAGVALVRGESVDAVGYHVPSLQGREDNQDSDVGHRTAAGIRFRDWPEVVRHCGRVGGSLSCCSSCGREDVSDGRGEVPS